MPEIGSIYHLTDTQYTGMYIEAIIHHYRASGCGSISLGRQLGTSRRACLRRSEVRSQLRDGRTLCVVFYICKAYGAAPGCSANAPGVEL